MVLLLEYLNVIIIGLAVITIFSAVLINFLSASGEVKKQKKSIVETGTMTAFFILLYLVIKFRFGAIENNNIPLRAVLMFLGWIIIALGVYFNIDGRIQLGKNWANQIKIYKKHTLVSSGVYSVVRHPLYASLIWMFYAASFIYLNWIAFLMNTLVFIPFMYYRARQEEYLLTQRFKQYNAYKKRVGMFFPKVRWQSK